MRARYALVDDLFSWEEFERLVRDEAGLLADEEDEREAAMRVVSIAGRLHTCISNFRSGPSLVSFFCRVIEVRQPEKFDRPGGGHGYISRILCGDETGEVVLRLWDDRAFAAAEISAGEILEVAGRPGRKGYIDVADLRKPDGDVFIRTRIAGMKTFSPVSFDVKLLSFAGSGEFSQKDGETSRYVRIITGDTDGEAEIVFRDTDVLSGISEGDHIRISGVYGRPSSGSKRSYSGGPDASVSRLAGVVADVEAGEEVHRFRYRVSDVREGWSGSLAVTVDDPGVLREYANRSGVISPFRSMRVSDESAAASLVIWGSQAKQPFTRGDAIYAFFAEGKRAVAGRILPEHEIRAGYGSYVALMETGGSAAVVKGIIVPQDGYFSVDGDGRCYPLKRLLPGMQPCMVAEVEGTVYDSGRLDPDNYRECGPDAGDLEERLDRMKGISGREP